MLKKIHAYKCNILFTEKNICDQNIFYSTLKAVYCHPSTQFLLLIQFRVVAGTVYKHFTLKGQSLQQHITTTVGTRGDLL